MEAKQALLNLFNAHYGLPNPLMPAGCPGVELLGVYVPEGEDHLEICHGFAYRWAIAAGKIAEDLNLPARKGASVFNYNNCTQVLYPLGHQPANLAAGYPVARVNGAMQTQPGDIIAMFSLPQPKPGFAQQAFLGHSLIARTPTIWYSANNAGTFGVGTGRSEIDTTGVFPAAGTIQVGWIGLTHQWMHTSGTVMDVVYRRIP
jgi:hypothetical protein